MPHRVAGDYGAIVKDGFHLSAVVEGGATEWPCATSWALALDSAKKALGALWGILGVGCFVAHNGVARSFVRRTGLGASGCPCCSSSNGAVASGTSLVLFGRTTTGSGDCRYRNPGLSRVSYRWFTNLLHGWVVSRHRSPRSHHGQSGSMRLSQNQSLPTDTCMGMGLVSRPASGSYVLALVAGAGACQSARAPSAGRVSAGASGPRCNAHSRWRSDATSADPPSSPKATPPSVSWEYPRRLRIGLHGAPPDDAGSQ
jgi:hypothetical protein